MPRVVPLRVAAGHPITCGWCGGTSFWILSPDDSPDDVQIHCYNQDCWDKGVSEHEEYEIRKSTFRMITAPPGGRFTDCE